jgi:hypothetical protein
MAIIETDQIEAEARSLLRETIERSAWYPSLSESERRQRIAQDVEQHWYVMAPEAAKRLVDRLARYPARHRDDGT